GEVHALVYRDLNDNGVHDPSEPFEKGALVTTGTIQADKPTDGHGSVTVAGLAPFRPVAVGIDESSLSDPMLVPRKALQVVVPRPGIPADVEIGLVGGGDIEGAMVKSGGLGFEGLDLELVDAGGKVVTTTRTDFDGFFLFERVAYGAYTIRVAKDSATAAKIAIDLGIAVKVTPDKAIVRLGSIHAAPQPQMALAAPTSENP
ncbi:MAG TPA: carboxypeptidase-like regulatory domain-containing protein, partial [Thermomicrobiales bacterium]|nr:carboxypeptidase-like regulatory domain-containing protein [Thermomicrobiales bacterium]